MRILCTSWQSLRPSPYNSYLRYKDYNNRYPRFFYRPRYELPTIGLEAYEVSCCLQPGYNMHITAESNIKYRMLQWLWLHISNYSPSSIIYYFQKLCVTIRQTSISLNFALSHLKCFCCLAKKTFFVK